MTKPTQQPEELTLFLCGPSKCEHDYSAWREYEAVGGGLIGTRVCSKCGAEAINEALWSD